MTYTIEVTRETARAWAWFVKNGSKILGGGYCRTKAEALSDAASFARDIK